MAERRDQVSISDSETGVTLRIWEPSDIHHAQGALFRAFRAGYDAAGIEPLKLEIEVLPSGDITATVSGCHGEYISDPNIQVHRAVISSVAIAAVRSMGYHPYGTDV